MAGIIRTNLGDAACEARQFDLATAHHLNALECYRRGNHPWGEVKVRRDLGIVARERGDAHQAWIHYRASLAQADGCEDLRLISDAIAGLAAVAATWDVPERVTRCLGAAGALREEAGTEIMLTAERAAHERSVTSVRAALGEAAFARAWATGRGLALAEAIAEALAIAPPPGVVPAVAADVAINPT